MKTDIETKYEYIKQFLLLFMLVLHFYFAVLCNISILEQHLFKTKKEHFTTLLFMLCKKLTIHR